MLSHARLPVVSILLATTLVLPSLWVGWVADDHTHRLKLVGSPELPEVSGSVFDLFVFADGDPGRNANLMDRGIWPWWTYAGIKAAMFRPLASLTHWIDYRLWPASPALMHLHSVLWFVALLAATAVLYRRMLGATAAAGLATLLFALDDAHATPVGFLANRNALLAAVFGVLAIVAHDRWRRDGWRAGAWLGPLLFAASLSSAEIGIATTGYLGAHAMFLDRATWRRRVAALLPYAFFVVVWRVVYTSAGYGMTGCELYVDPLAEPVRFLVAAVERAPILLSAQWTGPPAEVQFILSHLVGPAGARLLWGGALILLVGICLCLWTLVKRDASARFWAVGMLLSIVPACATFPMDRMVLFAGLGAFGLLAQFITVVFGVAPGEPRSSVIRRWRVPLVGTAYALVVIHAIVAPIALPWRARNPVLPASVMKQIEIRVPMEDSVTNQSVIVVNSPSALAAGFLPICNALEGRPVPRHTRALSPSMAAVTLFRPDERTLVIRSDNGYLFEPGDQLCRAKHLPMSLGQQVRLTGVTVDVTALTEDRRPAEAAFRFAVPLEHPSLRWLRYRDGNYERFTPPAIGERVALPRAIPTF